MRLAQGASKRGHGNGFPMSDSYALYNKDAYRSGDVLPNSSRVRVTVSPEEVRVEYVRSCLLKDASPEHPNGEIAFSYEIAASMPATKNSPTAGGTVAPAVLPRM